VADAAQLDDREQFDLVLCDAPCSGTGTLARNPEIRHRLTHEALSRHHRRQVEILIAAMRAVAPGGQLLYATCSLEPEENAEVVEEGLEHMQGFRLIPVETRFEALVNDGAMSAEAAENLRNSAIRDGFLRTLPGVHPCDGFFAALLIRDPSLTSPR
jgi:16S rRNA (cytosine967-C5)-methyltransferase